MVTKITDKKSPARFVFYVNLKEYYPRSWFARFFLPESIEAQKARVEADFYKKGYLKGDERIMIVPSNGTHLEKLYED